MGSFIMPYWTHEQEKTLINMVEQGRSLGEICAHFQRSPEAIRLKIRRLGLEPQEIMRERQRDKVTINATTTSMEAFLPEIKPAELISMREMMETMLGALEHLRNLKALSPLEIKRCRTIVTLARTYMHMLERYERWADLEQRLVNMEAKFLEMHKRELDKTTDPAKRAELEKQIALLEEGLRKSAKHYKPFEKRPSLMTPSQETIKEDVESQQERAEA
jgi:hypothetical protein